MKTKHDPPLIGIVGVCASGKTTLIGELERLGYHCRHIAQEHSYVQNMWLRLTNPDLLVFLEVSFEKTIERRKLNWTKEEYLDQVRRLEHARENADLIIDTNDLAPDKVLELVLMGINAHFSEPNQT